MIDSITNKRVITEIQAHAKGVSHYLPDTEVLIDIGGQDSKVIILGQNGTFTDFKMNDKCAAGTGKFLEIAATRLGIPLADFGKVSSQYTKELEISSMCAVFAESEIISLIAKKESKENIGYGVHKSIGTRVANMAKSMASDKVVAFSGGGALNPLLISIVEEELDRKISVPKNPQFTGAIGAALLGIK
ncbi:MAG: acyl-CoA dehydratase activase [Campylobacterales bacterium]|nr:acyl-CoA dehydratase activase [Campylobacterales bacterium]